MDIEAIEIENNGEDQTIKIPENFKIDDNKVYLKKMGNCLYIIPFHQPWQSFLDGINTFSSDFMEDRNQPSSQKRESLE